MSEYFPNYLKAIENPPSKLRKTFESEVELLKKFMDSNSDVLDVGCGAGRPAATLASEVNKIVAIDISERMLAAAKKKVAGVENVEVRHMDAFSMSFPDNKFNLVYATYNLIGSLSADKRGRLVKEMARVVKNDGIIITITWKTGKTTTDFLRNYYPSIGIEVEDISAEEVVTSKGKFARVSENEMESLYRNAGLVSEFRNVGPLWKAAVGGK